MESKFPYNHKYENKSNSDLSFENFRKAKIERNLTLRKQKKDDLNFAKISPKFNFINEKQYLINLNHLNTNNDDIRNFFIDLDKPEFSMSNLKYLLNSKNDDEVKFGIYALRIFFQDILRHAHHKEEKESENNNNNQMNHYGLNHDQIQSNNFQNNENKNQVHKIDKKAIDNIVYNNKILDWFFENDIFEFLFKIIKADRTKNEKAAQINIFECIWIFINISSITIKDENLFDNFESCFFEEENLNLLISLIDSDRFPLEIISNVLRLFINIIAQIPNIRETLIKSQFTNILVKYLQTEKILNTEITTLIFRVLHGLYYQCDFELNNEAYLILFKIFSLSLISFKSPNLIKYCLDILEMLSQLDIQEIIDGFADYNLMKTLNDIVFESPVKQNELIINLVLDIFYNLILKDNQVIKTKIIEPGFFISFYNNLIIKYRKENATFFYKIEENILMSVNNLIYSNHESNINYIWGDGIEILKLITDSANSVHPKTRLLGIKSYVNILYKLEFSVNMPFLIDILDIIAKTLFNDYENCYNICIQCLYFIVDTCKKQNLNINDLRNFFLKKGFKELLEKIKIKKMNELSISQITDEKKKEDEEKLQYYLETICDFLNED